MFPRIVRYKKKHRIYEYLVISESIHVKRKGSTTKNIATLGNIKNFTKENVEKLIDGLIRLFQIQKYSLTDQIEILESLEHGNIIFWQKIWNDLNLSKVIKKLINRKNKQISIDVEKYIEMMVINRCSDPHSKLGATRWITRTSYKAMKGYNSLKLDVEYFYRSMDYLLSIKNELELALFHKLKTLFSINVKLTFYDITSTLFYTENCPIGKNGHSRDKRPDKKQIVVGVVTSYEGFPIKHYVFDGNTKDETTVVTVIKELSEKYNIKETIFVGDRGMITKLNLSMIVKEGFEYIMGVKIRQSEIYAMLFDDIDFSQYQENNGLKIQEREIAIKDFLSWKLQKILAEKNDEISKEKIETLNNFINALSNKDKFNSKVLKDLLISNNITVTRIYTKISALFRKYVGQYETKHRVVICLNEQRKQASQEKRQTKIAEFSEKLSSFFSKVKRTEKAVDIERRFEKLFDGSKRHYRRYFTVLRDKNQKAIKFTLNHDAIANEEKYDGIFVLTTNNEGMKSETIVKSYKQLKEVETLFDDLKNFVDIRPIRHWLPDRVRAHVFICILGLLLKRIVENRCIKSKSTMHAFEELSKLKLIKYKVKFSEKENRYMTVPKVTQPTAMQANLFAMVGVKNPSSLEKIVW